jgi:hypothetical protein
VTWLSYKNDTQMELALMAVAASPTLEDACAFLKEQHQLEVKPSQLTTIVRIRPQQYEELRTKLVQIKEKCLTHNLLDNALYASDVTRVAMGQLMERLQEGRIAPEYLSRVARDVQDVQSKAVEKKLLLEERPSIITEVRSAPEIIRALVSKGVLKELDVPEAEVVEG